MIAICESGLLILECASGCFLDTNAIFLRLLMCFFVVGISGYNDINRLFHFFKNDLFQIFVYIGDGFERR